MAGAVCHPSALHAALPHKLTASCFQVCTWDSHTHLSIALGPHTASSSSLRSQLDGLLTFPPFHFLHDMTQSTCQLLWHTTRGEIIYKGERSCLGLGCLEANIPRGRHPKSQSVQEWQKKQGPNSQESFPTPVRKTFSPIPSNAFL